MDVLISKRLGRLPRKSHPAPSMITIVRLNLVEQSCFGHSGASRNPGGLLLVLRLLPWAPASAGATRGWAEPVSVPAKLRSRRAVERHRNAADLNIFAAEHLSQVVASGTRATIYTSKGRSL